MILFINSLVNLVNGIKCVDNYLLAVLSDLLLLICQSLAVPVRIAHNLYIFFQVLEKKLWSLPTARQYPFQCYDRCARAWIRFRSPYKVIIRALQLVLHYVLVSIGWHHCRTQNVIGSRNWSTVMWPAPIGWWRRVSPAIYTTRAQDQGVCCFGSLWDSSSSRLGSTPPSASSTAHCRQQPLLRESPPVARACPHTFHAVYCLGVSPTPPGGLEHPVIRVTQVPRIKNL